RICHVGRCRFPEEVRRELAAQPDGSVPLEPHTAANVGPTAKFRGSARHPGRSPHQDPAAQPAELWQHDTSARVYASPVVGPDGTIYVGSLDGSFVALTPEGRLRWRYAAGDRIYATAAVADDGSVYVGS